LPETAAEAVRRGAAALAAAGVDTARLDAELLLASILRVDRSRLIVDGDTRLDAASEADFAKLIGRRTRREPVAYILGVKEFRRISVAVDRRVLIPRPETELLVEVGLTLPPGARVVDVGCGSGAVALALKHERPDLEVWGTDVSAAAIEVARANAERLGLDARFLPADLTAAQRWDAVLANLPYVADESALQPEIAVFEPPVALYAGADGLDLIRRLLATLDAVPLVALEVGFDQADAVAALLSGAGFSSLERLRDLAGHERVLVGRR
jgi:release factor glutamine methyltransferase